MNALHFRDKDEALFGQSEQCRPGHGLVQQAGQYGVSEVTLVYVPCVELDSLRPFQAEFIA